MDQLGEDTCKGEEDSRRRIGWTLVQAGRSVLERVWQSSGAGVVAVSADLVRRANPGEK